MEGRLDAPSNCSAVQSSTYVGAGNPVPDGWYWPPARSRCEHGAVAGRERRDFTRHGGRPVDFGCCAARASAINGQPRDQAQWRSIGLSGHRSRQRCLGSCASSEALQTGREHGLGIVTDKLRLLWSPEQIAGWLKHTYLTEPLATGHQREHERPAQAVPAQGHRHLELLHRPRLNAVARQLNERPRKTLGFKTPAEGVPPDRYVDRLNPPS